MEDIYIGCDQPTTCPICGSRTEIIEDNLEFQLHKCPTSDCAKQFILEFNEEE